MKPNRRRQRRQEARQRAEDHKAAKRTMFEQKRKAQAEEARQRKAERQREIEAWNRLRRQERERVERWHRRIRHRQQVYCRHSHSRPPGERRDADHPNTHQGHHVHGEHPPRPQPARMSSLQMITLMAMACTS